LTVLALLVTSACASSQAEPNRPAASPPAPAASPDSDAYEQPAPRVAPAWQDTPPAYSPYGVELLSGDFYTLPTYYAGGRAYVMGTIGERYRIRVTNPTSRRVEAVVSVDGLDAVDGKTASYDDKRGYVILPYGDVTIEGFRTSLDQVATFRFSSVRDSYAGRKGQDRNVGVIGVAFFPERERPVRLPPRPIISDDRARSSAEAPPPAKDAPYGGGGAGRASSAPADAQDSGRAASGASAAAPAPSADKKSESAYGPAPRAAAEPPSTRPGLGTEFGEQRYSSVRYTTFQRESPTHPSSVVELRYNDREGLLALGIPVDRYAPTDLSLRESADPFPRNRFATPPPR
jgi:hypothetical protein